MNRGFVMIWLLIVIACNKQPYAVSNKQYKKQAKALAKQISASPLKDSMQEKRNWVGTVNFNLRKPNLVIIHHTAQNSCNQTLKTFTLERTQVSAHYVICRDGTVHHMLNDYLRAWHAGSGRWGNITDVNSSSIGIELDNNGLEPFPDLQVNSLLKLLQNLKNAYGIPAANFIGHADVAPSRKADPSRYFPWKSLADKGYGYWYNDTTNIEVPASFNKVEALRIVGYDMRDSAATFRAFRLHFLQDSLHVLDNPAQKILYTLYKKYL
jgi:N-acetylmuramoyl-L-alanine amidase